jgi:hypothetical protein
MFMRGHRTMSAPMGGSVLSRTPIRERPRRHRLPANGGSLCCTLRVFSATVNPAFAA